MPVNKDSLNRFRVIDRCLSDPNHNYTTQEILSAVNRCCPAVSLRMIQKDINTIVEEFGKDVERNKGGRGTVRYIDQTDCIFNHELSDEEKTLLKEVLGSLGQFDGLDNFTSLDLLKKKLDIDTNGNRQIIAFSKNEGLQIPDTLLGRLFTAISFRKVIRITYSPFNKPAYKIDVYPYLLKQYNDRWFLLCTPLKTENFDYDPEFILTYPLDRIGEEFEYLESKPYIDTPVDLKARFDEIIGMTLSSDAELEDIFFAVSPGTLPYIRTKWMHITQMENDADTQEEYRRKYPSLKDWTFFSICCRPNYELYAKFASYGKDVVLLEPDYMRKKMHEIMVEATKNYSCGII